MPVLLRAIHLVPSFSGLGAIEEVRRAHDPLADKIPPHITLVFPFRSDLTDETVRQHLSRVAANHVPFAVSLDPNPRHHAEGAWLAVTDGATAVRRLHEALYTGLLAPFLRRDIAFQPHVTIARFVQGRCPAGITLPVGTVLRAWVDEVVLEEILPDETSRIIATDLCLPTSPDLLRRPTLGSDRRTRPCVPLRGEARYLRYHPTGLSGASCLAFTTSESFSAQGFS